MPKFPGWHWNRDLNSGLHSRSADLSRADGSPAHGAHDCKLRAYVDRVGGTCGNARCETSTAHEAIHRELSTSSGEGAQGRPEPVNTTSEIDHDDLARSGA